MTETTHRDEHRDGAYWASLIADYEDDQPAPDPASMAADDISRKLGNLRELHARLAAYDRVHYKEIVRLEQRREALVAPLVERIHYIEEQLHMYALKSFVDFGKTGTILATPNGTIRTSRALADQLEVDDVTVAEWVAPFDKGDVVSRPPKVHKGKLRDVLSSSPFCRGVLDANGVDTVNVPTSKPLPAGCRGVFVNTDTGDVMAGVSWSPAGEFGCGRTFTVEIA